MDAARRTLRGQGRTTAKQHGGKCRLIMPPAPEFAEVHAKGGWGAVENTYRHRTDAISKYIRLTGAQCRRAMKGAVA